jgi:hypothetical protein
LSNNHNPRTEHILLHLSALSARSNGADVTQLNHSSRRRSPSQGLPWLIEVAIHSTHLDIDGKKDHGTNKRIEK